MSYYDEPHLEVRYDSTVAEADQEWSNDDWFPRALQTCLHSMAIVKPEDVVANMSVENIMQEIGNEGLITHHFDNREEAREWLQNQKATL